VRVGGLEADASAPVQPRPLEGRRPTKQENEEIADLLDQAIDQKAIEDKVSALGVELGAPTSSGWLQAPEAPPGVVRVTCSS
jgi:hypothetical protein